MPYPTFQASIQCPQCGQPITMPIEQVIDVGEDAQQRERLLRGQVNVLHCPRCGATGPIAVPMVYHDPSHNLLLAFVPHQMQLSMEEEEKEIGRLTNLVLDATPPEQRRGYLLNPTRVMTYDGLVEKIMEAEGISPDELRKQTEKIRLVMRMADVAHDDEALDALIDEHREEIDQNVLLLITVTMQQAAEVHDEETVNRYGALREKLAERLGLSADDLPSLGVEDNLDALIDQLLDTPSTMLQPTVAANRPLLDYNFFLHLSQRAQETEDVEEKQRLLDLRARLVEITDQMDKLAQEAMQRAAGQLNEVLRADDLDTKLQELFPDLDEAFLVVLSANVEQARAQGRSDVVEVLTHVYRRVVEMMESRLRPEFRAVNQLMRTEDPAARREQLRQELQTYHPAGFIEMLEAIAADLEEGGGAAPDVLDRLYTLIDEAREIAETELAGTFKAPKQPLFREEAERPAAPGRVLTPDEARKQASDDAPGIILP